MVRYVRTSYIHLWLWQGLRRCRRDYPRLEWNASLQSHPLMRRLFYSALMRSLYYNHV